MSDADGNTDKYAYGYTDGNAYCDSNGNTFGNTYGDMYAIGSSASCSSGIYKCSGHRRIPRSACECTTDLSVADQRKSVDRPGW